MQREGPCDVKPLGAELQPLSRQVGRESMPGGIAADAADGALGGDSSIVVHSAAQAPREGNPAALSEDGASMRPSSAVAHGHMSLKGNPPLTVTTSVDSQTDATIRRVEEQLARSRGIVADEQVPPTLRAVWHVLTISNLHMRYMSG